MSELVISPEYKELMLKTHELNAGWGVGGKRHYNPIVDLIKSRGFKTVLDYGCGQGVIGKTLLAQKVLRPDQLQMYDPGMPGLGIEPRPADLVISTDVMEHIEPALLDNVLAHVQRLATRMAYLHIAVGPAVKILPDGRNAHLIIQPDSWWHAKLKEYWPHVVMMFGREGLINPTFLCEP